MLMTPLSLLAQVLGTNPGDHVEISSLNGTTQNAFMNKTWLYRMQSGNDWFSSRLHNGISVDNSFLIPHINTRTWWERDPYYDIQSWGTGPDTYFAINKGNIGIGTSTPGTTLYVQNASINYASTLTLKNTANHIAARSGLTLENDAGNQTIFYKQASGNSDANDVILYSTLGDTRVYTAGNERLIIKNSGNIGIGTSTPNAKLAVNGNIRAHEIKVETANWPDYVFSKFFQLPTLREMETHIKEKGHLLGIPSAEEVKSKGVDLGDMNAKLLQKIEELTLHLIEKEKQMEIQNDRIKQLELNFEKIKDR